MIRGVNLDGPVQRSSERATTAVIGTLRPTEQRRATNSDIGEFCAYLISCGGGAAPPSGAEGDRTPDLCNANAALSQLSYSPAMSASSIERSVQRNGPARARGRRSEYRPTWGQRQGSLSRPLPS